MRKLIIIPARAGSKGLPGKNIKELDGLPLIVHTINFAKKVADEDDVICVSTNDDRVIEIAKKNGIYPPFKRPEELATDIANSYDVIMHSLNYYKALSEFFDVVLLLQPTSPIRLFEDYINLINQYNLGCDMAVTVSVSKNNPYYNLFEESKEGFLYKSKDCSATRRQDVPAVYVFNGSMYLINVNSLYSSDFHGFKTIRKSVMPEERSIDIDSPFDFKIAEYNLKLQELEN